VAGWTADYPSPREFLSLLSCASFTRGSSNNVNLAEFCNNRIDDEIKSASALQASDFHAASRRWTKIDHDLTDLAPLVSFANDRHIDFVSRRVGNYTYDIVWSIPLLDQMWVS
jgi:peptide/nickel transport system substrate-binding protein